jgi:murein L,D-transpeptidase YcbB/YkuD
VARGARRTIAIEQEVGVELVYWTAWVDEAGAVQFRPDVYRRDTDPVSGLPAGGASAPDA